MRVWGSASGGSRVSMMIMRPPQQGHGHGNTRCSSGVASEGSGSFEGEGAASNSRAWAMLAARLTFGKQPVVTDAMQAFWQNVDEEAPDELAGGERHRLVAGRPIEPIVLVPEGDAVLIGGYEP